MRSTTFPAARLALSAGAACAAAFAAAFAATPARADEPLPATVRAALAAAQLPETALYAVALPLEGAFARPWRLRSGVPVQPGSTMKLVTSIVALDHLGPNHRGFTELRSAAPVAGGVLKGDLVLRGGADPDFSAAALWALLQDLRATGITAIEGDVLLDRTRFRPSRLDLGVPPFDEAPEFPYNVIPDALNLAGSLLSFELRSTPEGAVATPVPPLPGVRLRSAMTPVAARCNDWDDHWKPAQVAPGEVTLNGRFPTNCIVRAQVQLIDRDELAENLFRSVWAGIPGATPWRGRVRAAAAPADTRPLARRESRTWGEVLRPLNKTSDNALTRLLFLELGVREQGSDTTTPTLELAARSVRRWLRGHGIDDTGVVLDNGSGLSRSERISPDQMARMLVVAWRGPHAADLVMSLPVPGVDGTMRNRLRDSPAAGQARLKTGTLRDVVALAGYLRGPDGRPWAVAMMVNDPRANAVGRPVLDALVDHFVRVGPHGAPAAAAVGPQGEGP
jgi:D-alanyl-D-alanine carboxypeptidase/D-alanyl-D-alanine-endopeptidase (penicillin-binding protein 4)